MKGVEGETIEMFPPMLYGTVEYSGKPPLLFDLALGFPRSVQLCFRAYSTIRHEIDRTAVISCLLDDSNHYETINQRT